MSNYILKTGIQYISMEFMTQQKEKSDMILEPLQVMIQLSMLSFCPIGTKVSVSDNILHIQRPTYTQGFWRWYQNDNKDDLYYLFHAIRRYYKWYKSKDNQMYSYILKLAINGIGKLIDTYSKSDKKSIGHTLNLYKNVLELETPDLFKDTNTNSISIDNVFENVVELYDVRILKVVYNTLNILEGEENETISEEYLCGLQMILKPTNTKIKKWINDNLTC